MKTTILNLILIGVLLSSCNMGKRYADYRRGGNNKKETVAVQKDTVVNEVPKIETASPEICVLELIPNDTLISINESKHEVEFKKTAIKEHGTSVQKKIRIRSAKKIISPIKKTVSPLKIMKQKNVSYSKVDWGAVWDVIVGIFLVGSLIMAIVAYLISVNFAIGEIIMMALLIALAILLCVGLSALITGMFPGM